MEAALALPEAITTMGSNARRSPGPTPLAPPPGGGVGKSLGSGFRARKPAQSPPSGVRAAQLELVTPHVALTPMRAALASEPEPDPGGLTQVGPPPASLLALARGELPGVEREKTPAKAPPRSSSGASFVLGLLLGATMVWFAKGDVGADVYRARVWVASSLRSVRSHATAESLAAETSAAADAPAAVPSVIPTVDVTDLPRVREETPSTSAGTASVASPPAPGAPALEHAPGPR